MGAILLAIGRFIVSKSWYAMLTKIIALFVLAGGLILLGLNDLNSRMETCKQPDATPIACFFKKPADASYTPPKTPDTTPPKMGVPNRPDQKNEPNTQQPDQGTGVCVYIPGATNACGSNPTPEADPASPTAPVNPKPPTDSGPTTSPPETPSGDEPDTQPSDQEDNAGCGIPGDSYCD